MLSSKQEYLAIKQQYDGLNAVNIDSIFDEQPLQLVNLMHIRRFHLLIRRAFHLSQTMGCRYPSAC